MASLSASQGFDAGQIRRLFLGGLVAAAGLHPYIANVEAGLMRLYGLQGGVLLLIEVICFGLLLTSALRPIFFVYEGFRLRWLTWPARKWNEWRVSQAWTKLHRLFGTGTREQLSSRAQRKVDKIWSFLVDFPLSRDPGSDALEATRLGNIIASYELYPESRYGVEAVAFWFHLVFLAPEAGRKDFEQKEAYAESILLASAAGAGVTFVAAVVKIGLWLGAMWPALALLRSPVEGQVIFWTFSFGIASFITFYWLSWQAHRDLGDSFRALVDLTMPKFNEWTAQATIPPPASLEQRAKMIAEYLTSLNLDDDSAAAGSAPRSARKTTQTGRRRTTARK
jgi:hypothetical protein